MLFVHPRMCDRAREDARRWRRNNKQTESGPPESATPVSQYFRTPLSWACKVIHEIHLVYRSMS